jgi:glycosyltransferase involved in cell wall biosynthesis
VLWAAAAVGVPVVQTLHNFRLLCPQAMLLRNDHVCEDCVGHVPWRGVVRACYRQSRMQSAALSSMLMVHRWLGTYNRHVARFIALSEFSRSKLIEGGLPAEKIVVKPNFVEVEHTPTECDRTRGLFVGRLSREKGVEVLLQAAKQHGLAQVDIVGDGEAYRDEVRQVFGAAFHGFKPLEQVMQSMSQAAFLILPSICYENFPRSIAEAFACATPVVASNMGAMAEIVQDGYTGLLFKPGDAQDLAAKVAWAQANPRAMREMGLNAYREYNTRYRAQVNHDALLDIYRAAINAVSAR